jgi:hypothetical protein
MTAQNTALHTYCREHVKFNLCDSVFWCCTGVNDASLSQLEIVTLLCMADRTHSQLMELMPERCGAGQSRDFELVLSKVCISASRVLLYWNMSIRDGTEFGNVCLAIKDIECKI